MQRDPEHTVREINRVARFGTAPGEDFFCLKLTGVIEGGWVTVTQEQLAAITDVLDPPLARLQRLVEELEQRLEQVESPPEGSDPEALARTLDGLERQVDELSTRVSELETT